MYKCKIIRRLLIDKINILIGIVTSIPLLLFVLISISNIDSMSYQTSLLVFSNLSILPTTISCLYYLTHSVKNNDYRKSLIIEFWLEPRSTFQVSRNRNLVLSTKSIFNSP